MTASMRKEAKPSPTESPLLCEVDPEPVEETLTALGGIPLVVEAFRSLGLPASVREQVRVKERQRGYDEATLVESFVISNAAGGECLDDFERLRQDPGLAEMAGHELPSLAADKNYDTRDFVRRLRGCASTRTWCRTPLTGRALLTGTRLDTRATR